MDELTVLRREIGLVTAKIKPDLDRRKALRDRLAKLDAGPYVTPIGISMRHGCIEEDDFQTSAAEALRSLEIGEEEGIHAAIGAYVGGALVHAYAADAPPTLTEAMRLR